MSHLISPEFDPSDNPTLIKWHVPDGATVHVDQPLCEIETQNATVDITAHRAGTLKHLKAEGDLIRPGDQIAEITGPDAAP